MKRTSGDFSSLNERQRDAVMTENKRVLVLAGAGSGKTQTLIQKLLYLINEKSVNSSAIYAITFTRNAANEMKDRLIMSADHSGEYKKIISDKSLKKIEKDQLRNSFLSKYKWIDNLTVKTFHSLCYSILRNQGVNEFDNKFRIIGESKRLEDDEFAKYTAPETIYEVCHRILVEVCEDKNYMLDLKRYILDYYVDKISASEPGSFISRDGKYFTTLNGEKVRSKSEQYIADWLYRHNVKYEYEPSLNIKDFSFKPDFFVHQADLYIEHISDKSYPTKDKEEQFKKGRLNFVRTYESMTKDSALFNLALDNIIKNRLPEDYQQTASLSFREEFNRYHSDVTRFLGDVIRVMDMIKVENNDVDSIYARSQNDQHERVRNFYKLAIPLIRRYNSYCVNKSYLDFNDLISRTISLLRNNPDVMNHFHNNIKYLLVDEFQDVNSIQVDLIKMLLTDRTQLFCVGDDWQSIYGFRGSNVSYIVEFEKHFSESETIKLNLNYRSTQNIVGASNEVIKHNKFKVEKELVASRISENKIVIFSGNEDEEEKVEFCLKEVQNLINQGIQEDEILFLYRRTKMFYEYSKAFKEAGINIYGKTIHGSKGLEARVVFIVGLTEGAGGFPDIWLNDRIFQVIKKGDYDLLMEEERRLFYVALTRAKERLYLITDKGNPSSFLQEIPVIYTTKTQTATEPIIEKIILCKKCSAKLDNFWIVCPYCGTQIKVMS